MSEQIEIHESLKSGKSFKELMDEKRRARHGGEIKPVTPPKYKIDKSISLIQSGDYEMALFQYERIVSRNLNGKSYKSVNTPELELMLKHFCGIEEVKEGFRIRGKHGTGKTTMIRSLMEMSRTVRSKVSMIGLSYSKIFDDFNEIGRSDVEAQIKPYQEVVINDFGFLGAASKKSYGNTENVANILIDIFYDDWQMKGKVFHFTTNRGDDQLNELLPKGIVERLKEMTQEVVWNGDNMRG